MWSEMKLTKIIVNGLSQ